MPKTSLPPLNTHPTYHPTKLPIIPQTSPNLHPSHPPTPAQKAHNDIPEICNSNIHNTAKGVCSKGYKENSRTLLKSTQEEKNTKIANEEKMKSRRYDIDCSLHESIL